MDLKEKLKEILKKNYGITSDAELLEELDDMESVDLGIFVTQIDTEKILNALDNSSVPISWHEMDRCALQSVIAKELILIDKEYERYSKKKKRAKMKKRIRFLKRSMVYIVPTAISLIFFGYLSDMLCAIRGSAELGSEWIAIPLMWVWIYALARFAVGDAY